MERFKTLFSEAITLGEVAARGRVSLIPLTKTVQNDELSIALPGALHAMAAFWHRALPDERALLFWGQDHWTREQRIRTDLLHQIFPRATLLMERHRRATANRTYNFSKLVIRVLPDQVEPIARSESWDNGPKAGFNVSGACWKELVPESFLLRFDETVKKLTDIVGQEQGKCESNWHHVVDAGRTLRDEFAGWLKYCRRKVADDSGGVLPEVAGHMSDWEQIVKRRHNTYGLSIPDNQIQNQSDSKYILKASMNAEAIDDFAGLLQSLRCYMQDSKQLVSWLLKVKANSHRAIGILGAFPAATEIPTVTKDLEAVFTQYVVSFDTNKETGTVGAADLSKEEEDLLPGPITKLVGNWTTSNSKAQLDERCAKRMVLLARELAEKHTVHEGRSLCYRFIYGASADLWQEIEDVLSLDIAGDQVAFRAQAEKISAHWSIFQPERVFGLVDKLSSGEAQGWPFIQRIVRVRPPATWSGLESEAMDNLARLSSPSLVVVVLRPGVVRLSLSSKNGVWKTALWDVRKGKVEPADWSDDHGAMATPSRAEAEELLGVLYPGEKMSRIEDTLASVLAEISEASGEGGLLIAAGTEPAKLVIAKMCVEMDQPANQMAWRRGKRLEWVDRTLLRAMFILDGATVLENDGSGSVELRPRVVAYPLIQCSDPDHGPRAYTVMLDTPAGNAVCTCQPAESETLKKTRAKLVGKGSRAHGAANLAVLLRCNCKDCKTFRVISISADGGITPWPPPESKDTTA